MFVIMRLVNILRSCCQKISNSVVDSLFIVALIINVCVCGGGGCLVLVLLCSTKCFF